MAHNLRGEVKKQARARTRGVSGERRPRLLMALYEAKGLSIARAGAPSPLAILSGRQTRW